jgi:hypothetical protein
VPQHVAGRRCILLLSGWLSFAGPAAAGDASPDLDPAEPFGRVNGAVITVGEYAEALRETARHTFYHAHPPEGELAAFQQMVAQAMVDRLLLVGEAHRRGLQPDASAVQEALGRAAAHDADPAMLLMLRQQLEERSLLEQLDALIRRLPEPTEAEVRAYYQAHPELFTEPAQLRLSVILLRVDPSSGPAAWQAARDEAEAILARLREGADFAALAHLHSSDASAQSGGDMGYLHEGMLAPGLDEAARGLGAGELGGPVMVLEGVLVIRLDDRRPARLHSFESVAARAAGLFQRERENAAAIELRDSLRASASIELREELLRPSGATGHEQSMD